VLAAGPEHERQRVHRRPPPRLALAARGARRLGRGRRPRQRDARGRAGAVRRRGQEARRELRPAVRLRPDRAGAGHGRRRHRAPRLHLDDDPQLGRPDPPGAPDFDFDNQTPEAQAGQFGYNNDFLALLRFWGSDDALLVANHEYTNENLMFRGWTTPARASLDELRIAMMAHGMSVVAVSRRGSGDPWSAHRFSPFNRRITAATPFRVDGPAAGSDLLRTSADPSGRVVLGTLNNCSGGVTPWGTVLSGEENFNQYFAVPEPPADDKVAAGYKRYGITDKSGRDWFRADPRFDTTNEPNEPHRFGWVVEVDPFDPTAPPRKHTALGRFKHEAANIAIARDRRVAVYLGDDERFDYLYKFVSKKTFRRGGGWFHAAAQHVAAGGGRPLRREVLRRAVAGLRRRRPLARADEGRRVGGPGMTTEEVLVWTRLAADAVGATKMDRPEDVEPSPRTGKVYMACTNNTARTPAQVDAANPRAVNKDGHVIEITEKGGDAAARTFSWKILIVCGDPADPSTYFSGFDKSEVSPISCPDNVAFDLAGNLWIATDGQPESLGVDDALLAVPVRGKERGHTQQFLAVPTGAETCGPVVGFDDRTALVAVQHPGDVPGASPDAPKSLFPYDGTGQPRPSVIQIHRTDGRAFLPAAEVVPRRRRVRRQHLEGSPWLCRSPLIERVVTDGAGAVDGATSATAAAIAVGVADGAADLAAPGSAVPGRRGRLVQPRRGLLDDARPERDAAHLRGVAADVGDPHLERPGAGAGLRDPVAEVRQLQRAPRAAAAAHLHRAQRVAVVVDEQREPELRGPLLDPERQRAHRRVGDRGVADGDRPLAHVGDAAEGGAAEVEVAAPALGALVDDLDPDRSLRPLTSRKPPQAAASRYSAGPSAT
jgi:secreted PhoX family phosphatase